MTLSPPTSRVNPAGADVLAQGWGLLEWNYVPGLATTASAPTSQTVYAVPVPVIAGTVYTGIKLIVNTIGSGASPTGFFVGLASLANLGSAGTMLAQSGNLNASTALTTAGLSTLPFSAGYTETLTGTRVALFFQNGAFGAVNPTFSRSGGSGNAIGTQSTQQFNYGTVGVAVTAFQANGQALANNYAFSGSPQHWWVALY